MTRFSSDILLPFPNLNDLNSRVFHIYKNLNGKSKPLLVKVNLNEHLVEIEVDTGAFLTVINSKTFDIIKSGLEQIERCKSNVKFKTYSEEIIRAQGQTVIPIEYENQSLKCTLYITEGDRPNLLERDCLAKTCLKWEKLFLMNRESQTNLDDLLCEFEDIFSSELGTMKNEKAKTYLKSNSIPKFLKASPVPYALKNKIELGIERMAKNNILEPVDVSEWATPIVPVIKEVSSIRICGDYKMTVNQVSQLDNYPIPKIDTLFAEILGCKKFAKLNLKHAHQQMFLDKSSRELLTINTHLGLFKPTRLTFGIKSTTGIFQRAIKNKLKGLKYTVVRVDDILVGGKNDQELLNNLKSVFVVLKGNSLRLKRGKGVFLKDKVCYLGYKINKDGLIPIPEKKMLF